MAAPTNRGVLTQNDTERLCPVAGCEFVGSLPAVYVHAAEQAAAEDTATDHGHGAVAADPEAYLGAAPQAVEFW